MTRDSETNTEPWCLTYVMRKETHIIKCISPRLH